MSELPCQRWLDRRPRYRPAGERIDPARYRVDLLDEKAAKAFVVQHHYSASYPAAVVRVGLWTSTAPRLVGVAVFSVPAQPLMIPRWLGGCAPAAGLELGRLVLDEQVPGNGESWFVARAFRALRAERPGLQGVVSCSDPLARADRTGRLITPGHVGVVYQALNGRHVGRTEARWLHVDLDGRTISRRAIDKARKPDQQGHRYAVQQLLAAGAPARSPGEEPAAWVARALVEGPFRRVHHPGNLVYTWGLSEDHDADALAALPYPRVATHRVNPLGGAP